jgi:hypothetical protein
VSGFADEATERQALRDRIERVVPGFAEDWQTASMESLRYTAQSVEAAAADQRRYGATAAKFLSNAGVTPVD